MPGPLTATEKAQIIDHGSWSNGLFQNDYTVIYVQPVLDGITDEASLAVIRGHLTRLNGIYEKLEDLSKIPLKEVKGIVFDGSAEGRLWALYSDWRKKLYDALDLQANTKTARRRSGGRPII
jgi:hypothetical protein